MMTTYILIALLAWNVIVFFLYAADKSRAKRGSRRISERTLILSALCLGGVGAMVGMSFLRHKTQHTNFKVLVPIGLVLTVAAVGLMFWIC